MGHRKVAGGRSETLPRLVADNTNARIAPQAANGPPNDERMERYRFSRTVPLARQARSSAAKDGLMAWPYVVDDRRRGDLRGVDGMDQPGSVGRLYAARLLLEEHPKATNGNNRIRIKGVRASHIVRILYKCP